MNGSEWVIFNGAMVYLDHDTRERLATLKVNVRYPKNDHIPMMTPKVCTFSVDDVNRCVYTEKNKNGVEVEKADWRKLTLS